jgi:hypothetical protein
LNRSATDEIEFDHSHISGGISKINTADNVFGIFTSRSMRERGQYQIQLMKTRSSSGVGQKVELAFNVDTLRITDPGTSTVSNTSGYTSQPQGTAQSLMDKFKTTSNVGVVDQVVNSQIEPANKNVKADVQGTKLKSLLNNLKENN